MEGIGQKKETDYIFDKTIKCDVCGKEFKTKQVRTGKARFVGTDAVDRKSTRLNSSHSV